MRKLVLCLALSLPGLPALAAGELLEVWKSPYCGCCGEWVKHMEKAGFRAQVHEVQDVGAIRRKLGIPDALGSCHSARVAGYALEGHVPADDVRRLLREKPKALGLTVPGMPPSSPGMDQPGKHPYETLLLGKDGKRQVWARH